MIRLCADMEKPLASGYVFYNSIEKGLDTYPEIKSEISLQGAYVQIGFSSGGANENDYTSQMYANQIFGFAPQQSWEPRNLTAPEATCKCALRMIDVFDWGTKGIDWDENWRVYFDRKTGWLCLGNPEFYGSANINFIKNAMAVLGEDGDLKALWINPVFRENIPLTL